MPLLKDLSCSIELSGDKQPLQELGTVYGDSIVETFVPVPKKQQTFTIHLSSKNFIAPGIAMYVFIDGVYQCNRNRQDLKLRRPPDHRSLVDFKVRQKEEMQKDGSMIARDWTFEKLGKAPADCTADSCPPNILENIGCIEVVVLRCAGTRNAKTAANMNLDGAADYPDYRSDRRGRSRTIAYDDRDPFASTAENRRGSLHLGPPYRSPHAKTVRELSKRGRLHYSEPGSPGTQRDISAPAFQYGSGPLPPRSRAETHKEIMSEVLPDSMSRAAHAIRPNTLEKIAADAVKRGVEELRENSRRETGNQRYGDGMADSSQIPGAWPASPRRPSKHSSHRSVPERHSQSEDSDDRDSTWEQRSKANMRRSTRNRAGTHVTWEGESGWDRQSGDHGWGSLDEHEHSWDTETRPKKRLEGWGEVDRRPRSTSRTVGHHSPPPHRASYISDRVSERRRSRHGHSHKAPSRSHSHWDDATRSSSEENDGWTRIEAPGSSLSVNRSDSTLKPSQSRSQVQPRRLSKSFKNTLYDAPLPSVLVTNAPTPVSARSPRYPEVVQHGNPSAYTQPVATSSALPPTWGCASERLRTKSAAATYLPPAPFSGIVEDGRESQCSSSWGSRKGSKIPSEGNGLMQKMQGSWSGDGQSDQARSTWDDKGEDWNEHANSWVINDTFAQHGEGWNPDKCNDRWGISSTSTSATAKTTHAAHGGWKTTNSVSATEQDKSSAFDAPFSDPNKAWTRPHRSTTKIPSEFLSKHHSAPPAPTLHRHFPDAFVESSPSDAAEKTKEIPPKPLHSVPPAAAGERGVHHQVLAGRGTRYGHAISRPLYMDSLEKPYAVFRFKYRGRSVLRGMFGGGWESGKGEKNVSENEWEAGAREKLGARLRALRVGRAEGDVRRGAGRTEKWVRDHSRG